jgi:hypothetical protein
MFASQKAFRFESPLSMTRKPASSWSMLSTRGFALRGVLLIFRDIADNRKAGSVCSNQCKPQ